LLAVIAVVVAFVALGGETIDTKLEYDNLQVKNTLVVGDPTTGVTLNNGSVSAGGVNTTSLFMPTENLPISTYDFTFNVNNTTGETNAQVFQVGPIVYVWIRFALPAALGPGENIVVGQVSGAPAPASKLGIGHAIYGYGSANTVGIIPDTNQDGWARIGGDGTILLANPANGAVWDNSSFGVVIQLQYAI
jgi:hypothetical protein